MGRKSLPKKRKKITVKTNQWLNALLLGLQYENLEQLTMDDIARIAGKSKSTIYEYFKSKEEVLETICQSRIASIAESLLKINIHNLGTTESYTSLIEIFAEGTVGISISFLQSIRKNYPGAWTVINDFTDHFVGILKEHYSKGIAERIYDPVSIELLGHIDKLFIIQVVTNPEIFSDEKYTISNLVRDYLRLRLYGLLKR